MPDGSRMALSIIQTVEPLAFWRGMVTELVVPFAASPASRMRRVSLPAKSLGVTGPRAKPSAAAAVASSSAQQSFFRIRIFIRRIISKRG